MMGISVAMCTYNGSRYIREQLDSIAHQTCLPEELVICDDGSSDDTANIVAEFGRTASFDLRFIQNKQRLGSTRNFEKAISLCRGSLIALSDQDDVWYPERIARQSSVLNADPTLGAVFSDATLIDEHSRDIDGRLWNKVHYSPSGMNGCHLEKDLAKVLLKHEVITGATMMFRADLRETILPVQGSWIHDGWITWMLVLYSSVAAIAEPLIRYRVHSSQQVGVGPDSPIIQLRRARKAGKKQYLLLAKLFEELRDHWKKKPGQQFEDYLREFEGKIRHSYLRASLPDNRLVRAYRISLAIPSYLKYTRGPAILCKDLLM